MVAPISGPFTSSEITERWVMGTVPVGRTQVRRTWYRQQKPYDRPLQFEMTRARMMSYRSCSTNNLGVSSGRASLYSWSSPSVATAYNKAYQRLVSQMKSDTAEMGAALAEYRKTADMVSDRVVQIWRFTRALRRGRFGEASALLRAPGEPRRKQKGETFRPMARSFSGQFLEYSFGWAPLVSDIHNGMKILTNGIPHCRLRASAGADFDPYYSKVGTTTYRETKDTDGDVRVTVGCDVALTNPNLWLANQLGLINPAGILWELVPFSFVVDYFGNIGNVINSWTEFFGVDIIRAYRTYLVNLETEVYNQGSVVSSGPCKGSTGGRVPNASWYTYVEHSTKMRRDLGLPGPSLRFNAPSVSLRRASTSIALLLQLLKGK